MKPIKVLVVDDSVFMRRTISKIITCDEIEVIGTASNGKDAIEQVKLLEPDLVTLDIEMPIMNGLESLKEIMIQCPLPVLMLSTLTHEGASSTLEALNIGAVDFITKKAAFTEMSGLKEELIGKILEIGRNSSLKQQIRRKSQLLQIKRNITNETQSESLALNLTKKIAENQRRSTNISKPLNGRKRPKANDIKIIGLGVSTGGPVALHEFLLHLPSNLPVSILIAQHMPPYFTKSLAERLDNLSQLSIKEAENGEKIIPGRVYIAPGGRQMTVNKRGSIIIGDEPSDELYKPSVNVLINSIANVYKNNALGIIMTGMGHDGKIGLKALHDAGGYIFAQDIDSCVVAGMPKSVIDLGVADEIHALGDLAEAVSSIFGLSSI